MDREHCTITPRRIGSIGEIRVPLRGWYKDPIESRLRDTATEFAETIGLVIVKYSGGTSGDIVFGEFTIGTGLDFMIH